MNKLSKQKRNQLILVALATLVVISGLWFLLLSMQREKLQTIANQMEAAEQRRREIQTAVDNAAKIAAELDASSRRLAVIEGGMARGDLYSWLFNTIEAFKQSHRVDIPSYSQVDFQNMTLFPKFPYKQAKQSISGTAYFSDMGKFLADFENQFPYMRVQNVELSPSPMGSEDREKLSFRMEIIALVKPGAG